MNMNKVLRYITFVGIFIIPFVPLVVANNLFFPFITGKNFLFRIVIEITFAAWVVLALTNKAYRPRKSWIFYSFAIFVGIMAVADAFGKFPFKSFWSNYERMEGWVTLAHLLMYFVVTATVLSTERLWDAFFQTSFGVNMMVILYSLLQIGHQLTINQGGVRVDATFGNATYLAVYSLFNIFIATLYLVRKRSSIHLFSNWFFALGFNAGFFVFILPNLSQAALSATSNGIFFGFLGLVTIDVFLYAVLMVKQEWMIFAAIIFFDLIVLFNTATRGAIIGLIAGAALTGLLIYILDKHHPRFRKVALGTIIATVLLVLGFYAVRNTHYVQTNPVLQRFASISLTETTTLSRFKLWHMAYEGFKERPILGWGQENFNYVFNKYYDPALYNQEQWFDRTHDVFFDWLTAGGILGLASYLLFFGSIVYYIWKRKGEGEFSVIEQAILTGLLVAYFIHNLFVFDNLTSYLLFVAVAAYVYNRTSLRPAPASHHVPNNVILPIAAIALVVAMYVVNIKPISANRALIVAISPPAHQGDITGNVSAFQKALSYKTFADAETREQIMSAADQYASVTQPVLGKDDLKALAIQEGKNQTEITPDDARYFIFYGTTLVQAGHVKEAIPYLQRAHQLSPSKQSIIFALASAYLGETDYKDAELALKDAFELEPKYEQARITYAVTAIYNNDMVTSDKLLSVLSTSTIAGSNDITQALYSTKQYARLITLAKFRVAQAPTAQNHVSLAAAYLYSGDRKNSIAELQAAIAAEPNFKGQGEQYIKQIQAGKIPGQ